MIPDPSRRVRYIRARNERFPRGAILAEAHAPHYLDYRASLGLAGEGGALMCELLEAEVGWRSRNPLLATKMRSDRLKARRRRARMAAAS